jgi:hypothetical protein
MHHHAAFGDLDLLAVKLNFNHDDGVALESVVVGQT